MTPADVRHTLIHALQVDLVGPAQPDEMLEQSPSRWYLTGFLAPLNASEEQRIDLLANDEPDMLQDEQHATDDAVPPERPSARRAPFPASLGLSVLLGAEADALDVRLDWGEYHRLEPASPEEAEADAAGSSSAGESEQWQRTPCQATLCLPLPPAGESRNRTVPVPDQAGLKLAYAVRPVRLTDAERLPPGARVVSVFLTNEPPGHYAGPATGAIDYRRTSNSDS